MIDLPTKSKTKDMDGVDLSNDKNALSVMKKPIPLKVEFAKADGVCTTKEGSVPYVKGDAIMIGTKGEKWPIKKEDLDRTYILVDKQGGYYAKKPAEVLAVKMVEEFTVNVSWSKAPLTGKAGDWLIQYKKDDYGIVESEIFDETYTILSSGTKNGNANGNNLKERAKKRIKENKF